MIAHRLAARIFSGIAGLALWLAAGAAVAQGREVVLAAPPALTEAGLLDFVLPRFALKNATRVRLVAPGDAAAQAALTADPQAGGSAAFTGRGQTWRLVVLEETEGTARLSDWLFSEAGRAAVASFEVDGETPFGEAAARHVAVATVDVEGDAARGERLSYAQCGRCHVVGAKNRLDGIGSTPSFPLLRAFPDWQSRFAGFYELNPHPAFTQIAEVTPPFDPQRPPPIAPMEMTQEDVDNIVAFVAGIAPADLGAPIASQ